MSIRRSELLTAPACTEIAIEMVAQQLASIDPADRASVCVEALKRARHLKPPTEKGTSDDYT